MKQRKSMLQRITDYADLPDETLPFVPLVELCGDKRVLIENHRGIREYGPDRICVRVRYGEVSIWGSGLKICRMFGPQLVIVGRIDKIELWKGKDK